MNMPTEDSSQRLLAYAKIVRTFLMTLFLRNPHYSETAAVAPSSASCIFSQPVSALFSLATPNHLVPSWSRFHGAGSVLARTT